jgi:adiponectin receptor
MGGQRYRSSSTIERSGLIPAKAVAFLPSSLQALDLHSSGRTVSSALASLRMHYLSYLADLEARLALLDFAKLSVHVETPACHDPDSTGNDSDGSDDLDLHVDDISIFITQGFELLRTIREDVLSYLPEDFDLASAATSADLVRTKIHDHLDVRSRLPEFEMPTIPSMDELRTRLSTLSPSSSLSCVPRLQAHLIRLQEHFKSLPFSVPSRSSLPLPWISPPKALSDLIVDLLNEDTEESIEADIKKEKIAEETMHEQVKRALVWSHQGCQLISYEQLPEKWRNNEFVLTGYR